MDWRSVPWCVACSGGGDVYSGSIVRCDITWNTEDQEGDRGGCTWVFEGDLNVEMQAVTQAILNQSNMLHVVYCIVRLSPGCDVWSVSFELCAVIFPTIVRITKMEVGADFTWLFEPA